MLMEPAAETEGPSSPNLGNYTLPVQLAEAADALTVLDAEDYHQWIEAGMALHATGLGDLAYQVWVEWSGRSGKFDHKVQRAKWLSFSTNRSAGVTIKTLFSRAQSAGWKNPMAGTSSTPEPEVTISDLEKQLLAFDAFADPFTPIAHFVDRWIPHNEVTLFAGHGGSGKSYVAMSLAIHVALGRPFCGLDTVAAPVLFFSGEDGAQVILRRFHSLCKALSVDPAELDGKLLLLDASDIDPALHREARGVTETKLLGALSELIAKRNIGLVVVDNASDTFDDDEIKRARVRQFVRSLRSRIARPNRAVLLLAHVNKVSAISGREAGKEDYSGSTAWHNSVRSRLSLNVEKDENLMTIEHQKANLGPRAKPVRMRWHDGVPLQDGTFTDAGAAAAAEYVSAERVRANNAAKGILVLMVQDFNNRGETVTTSNTGGFSVWHLLSKRAGFPKSVKSASDLMDLLAELQAEGRIYRSVFRTKDRKMREVFVVGSAPMPDENDQKEGN
jgi:RecA-family ATPase